jgi:hypothetical protein
VEFDLPGVSEFTIKVLSNKANTVFTDDEKTRNSLSEYTNKEVTYHTESSGIMLYALLMVIFEPEYSVYIFQVRHSLERLSAFYFQLSRVVP